MPNREQSPRDKEAASIVLTSTSQADGAPARRVVLFDASGNAMVVGADNADTVAGSSTGIQRVAADFYVVTTGGTWSRGRDLSLATNNTSTGILAAGIVAQLDDTSPQAITENNYGTVRMGPHRGLYVEAGGYSATRVTADTQIKATPGFVHLLAITSYVAVPTAGLLTLYDSAAESGTAIYSEWITTGIQGHTILLDVPCLTGIYIGYDASLANVQATVVWR